MSAVDTLNPSCPDWQSHYENAAEYLFGIVAGDPVTSDQDDRIVIEAEASYADCEGHQ